MEAGTFSRVGVNVTFYKKKEKRKKRRRYCKRNFKTVRPCENTKNITVLRKESIYNTVKHWRNPSLISRMVSVNVKHHVYFSWRQS